MIRVRRRPLPEAVVFTITAFATSWLCWLPLVAATRQVWSISPGDAPLLILLGTFGPLFAAVAVVGRTSGFRGLGEFIGQAFRWRVSILWYAAALLGPALVRIVVLHVNILNGGSFADVTDPSHWVSIPLTFVFVLLIGGPTGEEFGWRGFLLQRVQPVTGVLWAAIVIGVITALWHLPLFFIPDTPQSDLPFALFTLRTVSLSLISTLLYNGTRRSLLLVLLFHAAMNTWPNTLYILDAETSLVPYISSTIIYSVAAALLAALGLLRGRGDRRKAARTEPAVAA
ncbi:MAG TPA: type II CAAX endopeptidase family protein [Candidatus Dormibacteraeota bacterium]|nr:type II CAAX endopeptidase family protein [Candidatus Dormibacteraeota bacterium]